MEVPQPHCLDPVADVPVSTQRQAPTIQTDLRTVELPQFLHSNHVAVVAVVLQRQGWDTACVNVVVPPIMEGLSAVVRIAPHEHVQERIVEQRENVVVPPIMELSRSLHMHKDRRCDYCVAAPGTNHSGSTEVGESSFAFIISIE